MAAILGLEDEQIQAACRHAAQDEVVEAVNFNSPGQVVIAGNKSAVERAIAAANASGAKKAITLPVSVPSHCALMQPASVQLAARLAITPFQAAQMPVLHNVDAQPRDSAAAMRDALTQQLYRPVRWVNTIEQLKNTYQVDTVVEFGPGKVLAGLNRRIDRKMGAVCIHDRATLAEALKLCNNEVES